MFDDRVDVVGALGEDEACAPRGDGGVDVVADLLGSTVIVDECREHLVYRRRVVGTSVVVLCTMSSRRTSSVPSTSPGLIS